MAVTIRIDAHQHFWKLARGDYDWITPDLTKLNQDYLPQDLQPFLNKHHIQGTIVVQAAPTIEETEYLLDLYDTNESIVGVVGWLEMDSSRFIEQFIKLSKRKGLIGIRPMIQDIPDDKWILRQQVRENIAYLVDQDFPIDLLVLPKHLPYVAELLEEFPKLRGVINHAAKPNIKDQDLNTWGQDLRKIASYPGIMCKLSGLITEAAENWSKEDIKPVIDHVINCFGMNRVMFGSDWPVCLLAGSYHEVYEVLYDNLPINITEKERQQLFGGNASRFYKLTNE